MRTALLGAVGAIGIACSSVASAAVTVVNTGSNPTTVSTTGPTTTGTTTELGYSKAGLPQGSFTEYLSFNNSEDGDYTIVLSTSSAAVDFMAGLTKLVGSSSEWVLTKIADTGTSESWELVTYLAPGTFTLNMAGNNSGTGSLGGTLTVTRAVPEPATWAIMLLGFAGIGAAMRRQYRPALAQIA